MQTEEGQQSLGGLSDLDRKILELEKRRFKYQGSKEKVMVQELGLSPVAYYQRLNALLDNPQALAQEPALLARLRRIRQELA